MRVIFLSGLHTVNPLDREVKRDHKVGQHQIFLRPFLCKGCVGFSYVNADVLSLQVVGNFHSLTATAHRIQNNITWLCVHLNKPPRNLLRKNCGVLDDVRRNRGNVPHRKGNLPLHCSVQRNLGLCFFQKEPRLLSLLQNDDVLVHDVCAVSGGYWDLHELAKPVSGTASPCGNLVPNYHVTEVPSLLLVFQVYDL